MLDPELKTKINKLWNAFWAGGLANPLSAIEQISYLIFMKRLDDLDAHHASAAQSRGQPYKSVFEGKDDCRWSNWKHMNAESMYKHVTEVAFPFIKNLHNGEDVLYSKYMKDATFMIPKPSLLQEAVTLIDEINIGERPDIQGDIYEHLLGELKTAGKNGQFRTPRHIIRMMVELVDPDIGQKICDPACGTGGFLVAAYQHILKKYTDPEMVKIDEDGTPHGLFANKIVKKEHWDLLWNETFFGYDFEITMIRVALMNMILHGISRARARARITRTAKKKITAAEFKAIEIPVPSIEIQQRFAQAMCELDRIKNLQKQSYEQIAELSQSMMWKAFRGELTSQKAKT
jgi:type I restriction enzyme M protein